jgi:hypothetical protein
MSSGESTPTIVVGYDGSDPARAALRSPRDRRELAAACSSSTLTSCDRGEALPRDLPLQDDC